MDKSQLDLCPGVRGGRKSLLMVIRSRKKILHDESATQHDGQFTVNEDT